MRELAEILASYYSDWGVTELRLAGGGLENLVYRAETQAYGPVAIRVPRERWYHNDNDPDLEARQLLRQEAALARHMARHGVPVPQVLALHESDDLDFLASVFVVSDGSAPDLAAMGRLTRAIHDCPVPDGFTPVAHGGRPLPVVLAERIVRRAQVVERLAGVRLNLPPVDELAAVLESAAAAPSVLHMDMRPANLLTRQGEIAAVVDWSNAAVGDPALELARIAEYGHLTAAFSAGYGAAPTVPEGVELLYRLDTAVMLAVVFLSEAPDAVLGLKQVARVRQLTHYLVG